MLTAHSNTKQNYVTVFAVCIIFNEFVTSGVSKLHCKDSQRRFVYKYLLRQ